MNPEKNPAETVDGATVESPPIGRAAVEHPPVVRIGWADLSVVLAEAERVALARRALVETLLDPAVNLETLPDPTFIRRSVPRLPLKSRRPLL